MADERIRGQIARAAAQLMYDGLETEYFTAKRKAAGQLGLEYRHRPHDLPSNAEIRDRIRDLACLYEGERRTDNLREMRLEALNLMRRLARFRPALIGSVCTGHTRKDSDIDLHVFSDSVAAVTLVLDELSMPYEVEHKRVIKHDEERVFTHVHAQGRFKFELTIYAEDKATYTFRSSITGKAMERVTIAELELLMQREYPGLDLSEERLPAAPVDRFEIFRLLLLPLEEVKQSPVHHPEGDVLYHSLQVFEWAREERAYDEEFLLAALLHDVGKALDPSDHVGAALQALEGMITERTATLIAHHMEANAWRRGTLGHKAHERLAHTEDWEDLLLLSELDGRGRQRGVEVCTVEEALEYVRGLEGEAYLT